MKWLWINQKLKKFHDCHLFKHPSLAFLISAERQLEFPWFNLLNIEYVELTNIYLFWFLQRNWKIWLIYFGKYLIREILGPSRPLISNTCSGHCSLRSLGDWVQKLHTDVTWHDQACQIFGWTVSSEAHLLDHMSLMSMLCKVLMKILFWFGM